MYTQFPSILVFLWNIVEILGNNQTFVGHSCSTEDNRFVVNLAIAPDTYICGASLINHIWSLTAARCVYARDYGVKYIIAVDLSRFPNHTKVNVIDLFVHPEYKYEDLTNDIALLKLDNTLKKIHEFEYGHSNGQYFVRLPRSSMDSLSCSTGLIMGWGVGLSEIYNLSDLHCTNLPLISFEECKTKYPPNSLLREGMHICSLGVGTVVCRAEFGDPLLCDGIQIGIVSWGVGCINPEDMFQVEINESTGAQIVKKLEKSEVTSSPGVYSRVETYMPFIEETMKEKMSVRLAISGGYRFDIIKWLFVAMFLLLYI